jgi:hypothetical protein
MYKDYNWCNTHNISNTTRINAPNDITNARIRIRPQKFFSFFLSSLHETNKGAGRIRASWLESVKCRRGFETLIDLGKTSIGYFLWQIHYNPKELTLYDCRYRVVRAEEERRSKPSQTCLRRGRLVLLLFSISLFLKLGAPLPYEMQHRQSSTRISRSETQSKTSETYTPSKTAIARERERERGGGGITPAVK